ncbi:MAG: twin-arginine translocase TatA/TatE family subunit [Candidatus Sumerlaeia bacterium]|nr:twin-arginine translocase TatA/TatE family subunit [Candidatus Sumerlaeia bacterium]
MDLSLGLLSFPGGTEWFIILIVVILIFGPKNLPKLGNAMGRFISNLKAGQRGELEDDDEDEKEPPVRSKPRVEGKKEA